jgi:hypothetical protein
MSDFGETEADSLGDLGEQPLSSFEEVTFEATNEPMDDDESDDDESVAPVDEGREEGVSSVDTQVVTDLEARGERKFVDDVCLVGLSQ